MYGSNPSLFAMARHVEESRPPLSKTIAFFVESIRLSVSRFLVIETLLLGGLLRGADYMVSAPSLVIRNPFQHRLLMFCPEDALATDLPRMHGG